MKKLVLLMCIVAMAALDATAQKANPNFDAALAKRVGADEYGMKMYVLVMLKTGTNITETKVKTDSLFAGHMANINRLVGLKKLIVAGPLGKNDKNYRGIFILDTKSIDEAKQILATDPAIGAKLLDADLFNWYGSAALSEYLPASDKVGKLKF